MNYFSTRQGFLISSYSLKESELEKIDKFLYFIDKSGVLKLVVSDNFEASKGGRPVYNQANLFAAILYCFTFGKGTLRSIEEMCQYDLRVIYIMDGETPTHMTISNFINEKMKPRIKEIYAAITMAIVRECDIDTSTIFIDGSKFEADANKYKFVWKPVKYHEKLSDKIRILLEKYHLNDSTTQEGIIEIKTVAAKLSALSEAVTDRHPDFKLMTDYLSKSIEYEEKERICGPDRNSYYKTDRDATAMCLKEDYYSGLGSNMHAAYNSQLGVSDGIIIWCMISQSRSDFKDFIPFLEEYARYYGVYPQNAVADAGYGSQANYQFLADKGITNYVKHSSWEGNVSGRNPFRYRLNNDETITCLNGITGKKAEAKGWHHKKKGTVFYEIEGCTNCPFVAYCKKHSRSKEEDSKLFEVNEELRFHIQQSEENLLSVKGIEMRVNRSAQVEGAFGVIKQDFGYERFRRTGLSNVVLEFMLVCLGYNIRKLFKHFSGSLHKKYWKAPKGIKPESFKKPSAKRLSNRANKESSKSVNQQAKDSYKYQRQ